MQNWKRLLVFVAFTAAVGAASFVAEDEVNAQSAGSAGSPPSNAGTSAGGGTSTPPPTGTSTTSTSDNKDGGGCSIAGPHSDAGLGALFGLAVGLAFMRRRKDG